MEIEFPDLQSVCRQLNNDIEKVKEVVEDLSQIISLLCSMQDRCVGMDARIGERNYKVIKEGDKFLFLETEAI